MISLCETQPQIKKLFSDGLKTATKDNYNLVRTTDNRNLVTPTSDRNRVTTTNNSNRDSVSV